MHLHQKDEKASRVGQPRTGAGYFLARSPGVRVHTDGYFLVVVTLTLRLIVRVQLGYFLEPFQNFNLNYGGSLRMLFLRQCNATYILLKIISFFQIIT
jgi:hypothetical protein